jgi:hypothetical protein
MITTAERERVVAALEETGAALVHTVREFPGQDFSRCPQEEIWSAAHTLEHIVFVEGRALGRIHLALQQPADPSRKSAWEGRDERLFSAVRSREERIKAPSIANPAGTQSVGQLLTAFEETRQKSIQFARETDADLRFHFAAHPLFGELDCYQWLMLIPSHCERHRLQIEECRQSLT